MSRQRFCDVVMIVCFVFSFGFSIYWDKMSSGASEIGKVDQQERAHEVVQKIKYIYDERTGLCFARLGVGLALVPYEKVKDHLLNPPEHPPKK